jgi:transposase
MGERMKTIKDTWSNANNVWTAHKLRNQIAHETDVSVGYDDARRALSGFKQALKDLGAI